MGLNTCLPASKTAKRRRKADPVPPELFSDSELRALREEVENLKTALVLQQAQVVPEMLPLHNPQQSSQPQYTLGLETSELFPMPDLNPDAAYQQDYQYPLQLPDYPYIPGLETSLSFSVPTTVAFDDHFDHPVIWGDYQSPLELLSGTSSGFPSCLQVSTNTYPAYEHFNPPVNHWENQYPSVANSHQYDFSSFLGSFHDEPTAWMVS